MRGNPDKTTVIVDEVQKVPDILSAVHSLIAEKTGKTFILTGSSARKLKRTGIDLLAGRVLLRTLHPFLLSELPQPPVFVPRRGTTFGKPGVVSPLRDIFEKIAAGH